MARTIKKGLDYFPFDVDFFQDIRIRKLIKYQGGKAVTVYALLLCTIYKNGYYAEWDKELPFIISEQSGYTEAYIQIGTVEALNGISLVLRFFGINSTDLPSESSVFAVLQSVVTEETTEAFGYTHSIYLLQISL